jgi:hypothetical protein
MRQERSRREGLLPVRKLLNQKLWNAIAGMKLILRASAKAAYGRTPKRPLGSGAGISAVVGVKRAFSARPPALLPGVRT